ncbi:MAG: amidohydrolase [Halioglobus sp.]
MSETAPWAESLAVLDGRITAVGSTEDVMRLRGDKTIVHDLRGHMVMPGIHDTHLHPYDAGIGSQVECVISPEELGAALGLLEECLKDVSEGQWLRGGQWHESFFSSELAAGRHPKEILDEIAPNNPVFLMDWTVHNAWLNSRALEVLNIDAQTLDPAGGVIVRDSDTGEATGLLLDNAAYGSQRRLPAYSIEERTRAMRWSLDTIAKYGVTTIKDALTTESSMEVYEAFNSANTLPVRVKTSLSWKSSWANSHEEELALIARRGALEKNFVATDFAKIMLDGVPISYTSALLEPYAPSEAYGDNFRGKLMHDPEQLKEDVAWLDGQGITVKIHATGDRAVRVALNAIEAARKANGDSGLIHEISHAETIHQDDMPRFNELNVAAEMCPILWYPIPGLDWVQWLGDDGREKVWPIKTMVYSGALVIYGSDWPVVLTPNPWPGIESMVTRSDPSQTEIKPDWPEEAVSLKTALKIFTLNGAIANKVGGSSGSLEAGKDADFIVLDRQLFDIPITDVGETEVLMSVVGGNVIVDDFLSGKSSKNVRQ